MYRDNLADTSHRGGVVQARAGNLGGAETSLDLALRRTQAEFIAANSSDKIGLGAQGADIEADLGNVLRLSAVAINDREHRISAYGNAYAHLRSADSESSYILTTFRDALSVRNRQYRRDLREVESINGKVLSGLGRLALAIQLSDGEPTRDQIMGRVQGRRSYFKNARQHLRLGSSGINLVENDLWAMAEARINHRTARNANVDYWRRNLAWDLGWTLFRDFKNFNRASRLALNIGRAVVRGEDTTIDAFISTL